MLICPFTKGRRLILAARRDACSSVLSCLSLSLISSIITLFQRPGLIRPIVTSHPNVVFSTDAAVAPSISCTGGIYTTICKTRYSPQMQPKNHLIKFFNDACFDYLTNVCFFFHLLGFLLINFCFLSIKKCTFVRVYINNSFLLTSIWQK